jgi:hypothetical protein
VIDFVLAEYVAGTTAPYCAAESAGRRHLVALVFRV